MYTFPRGSLIHEKSFILERDPTLKAAIPRRRTTLKRLGKRFVFVARPAKREERRAEAGIRSNLILARAVRVRKRSLSLSASSISHLVVGTARERSLERVAAAIASTDCGQKSSARSHRPPWCHSAE